MKARTAFVWPQLDLKHAARRLREQSECDKEAQTTHGTSNNHTAVHWRAVWGCALVVSPVLSARMIKRIAVAVGFSLFYISMYPILIGGYVIYVYPYWSPGAAFAWVACGIALQVWLCVRPSSKRGSGLFAQVGAGLLYALSMVAFSGGCYQS